MSKIIIRDILAKDNQALIELVHATLHEFGAIGDGYAMADAELLDMFSNYQSQDRHYYVVEKDGCIQGGAGLAPLDDTDDQDNSGICELRKMYFSSTLRGLGVGKQALDKCIQQALDMGYHSIYLETINEMQVAQKLYKSRGFKYIKQRMGKTGHHACGVFMLMKL
ncbi:hypothetical protein MNBD_GAMMA01-1739 [hydrothermal vent metagenome]|uniref:N-acetyltransferase domain-containing protein n=1 Tax=hydrothermal vent metagenome TaxID=652676 RepID=A0A3B0W923_9ZZZZ